MNKRFYIVLTFIIIIFLFLLVFSIQVIKQDKNNHYIKNINLAIEDKNIKKLKKIIKNKDLNQIYKGADCEIELEMPCHSPLQLACSHGEYEIVKLLVENGADVNYMETIGDAKQTPLIHTIDTIYDVNIESQLKIVKYLLNKGADKSIKDNRGNNALYYTKKLLSKYDFDARKYIEKENVTPKEKQIKKEIIELLS